jgi:hypothetical protein
MSKTPKWIDRWNELVGENKFLEIKGWYDWQEKSYTTDYIRDYYGKDEDSDYGSPQIRVMRRWMMDWLRRQRGRLRHTLPNDPHFLVTRMNLHPDDAKWVGPALVLLVECRFLKPTNEQVRDQKWTKEKKEKVIKTNQQQAVVDEVVEQKEQDQKPTQSMKSSQPPVHPKKEQSRPVAAAPECNHWPRCTNGKGPCKTTATPPASPRPAKKLGFDPYSIEPFDDWTADEIRLVSCYWWEYAKNTWYRDNVNRPDYFREKFAKIASEMPRNWQPPKSKTQSAQLTPKADPACEKCHGRGVYKIDKPGYPAGMFFQRVVCACTTEASISPVQT